ncbi:MAG: 16S rRNA (guanine(527)-N(7))-methyltransferase RsmG [Candidatus Binatia bacterium]
MDWAALREWTQDHAGLSLTDPQLDQLRAYLDTLLFWNRKLALISHREAAHLVERHVADSLFVAGHVADGDALVDLGSGAGFPGLPIAIARPAVAVCLMESRGKKASFLCDAKRQASIGNARIYEGRIEAAATDPAHAGRYTVATARALTSTDQFLTLATPLLSKPGRALAMRSTIEPLPDRDCEVVDYILPEGTPRRLLAFGI